MIRSTVCASALLACFAVGSSAVRAQTEPPHGRVIGHVTDAASGQPVVAAQVRIIPTHHEELTHADGRFVLDDVAPGTYTIAIERLGYRRFTREIEIGPGATVDLRVQLDVFAIELGEIVVTGTLTARSRDDVLSPVSTISGAELDRRSDQTVASMLDGKPGLTVTSLGPATARPVIRGLGGDRILLLEDGQRPGDMSSTSSDHAVAIEPLTARRIEVVRGPMSLLYGSSALGGVVNVIREEIPTAMPDDVHGVLSVQGASVNRGVTAGGSLTTGFGPLALRADGSARTGGDVSTPAGRLENTGASTYDVGIGIGLPGEHRHAGASYRFYANDYGIPGGFVGGHATGVEITMRRHTMRASGELHREQRFFAEVEADVGYTNYHHSELEPSGSVGTDFQQDVLQGDLIARHGSRGVLREGAIGVRAQYRDIATGGTLRTPSTYDWTVAGFAVEEIGREALRFQFGLRYDLARYVPRDTTSFVTAGGQRIPVRARSFGSVSGSAGMLWVLSRAIRAGVSVSRAYRTPDFNELFSNGPHLAANSFDVGDPSLGQEIGYGADVFVRLGFGRMRAEVAAFANVLNDYVFPSSRGRAELGSQGGRPRFQYTNEDARFTGLEAELEASLSRAIVLEASGSLVNAKFTSDRAPIPVFEGADTTFIPASTYPPLIPPAQSRIGMRMDRPGHFIGAGVKLVARQGRLGDFETPTPAYALADFNAGLRMVRGSMLHTITLRADNLLDTEYRDHLSRIKEIMPGPGRGVSLLYRLVF